MKKKVFCDIGNTTTKLIFLDKNKVFFNKIPTDNFLNFIRDKNLTDSIFYICCVVEELRKKIKNFFQNVRVISYTDIKRYIKINYDVKNLGMDRLINIFAAKELFGVDTVVVSLGTAVVIDYLDKKNRYLGGEIFPGIGLITECLFNKTSKLPYLHIEEFYNRKFKLIGKNTKECIVNGIFNFLISGIKNFINNVKPKNIIISGGDAKLLAKFLKFKNKVIIENLTILGLLLWCFYNDHINKLEWEKIKKYFCRIDLEKKIL